jgi:hypothetical protein
MGRFFNQKARPRFVAGQRAEEPRAKGASDSEQRQHFAIRLVGTSGHPIKGRSMLVTDIIPSLIFIFATGIITALYQHSVMRSVHRK